PHQPTQIYNNQSLKGLQENLINPVALQPKSSLTTSATSSEFGESSEIGESNPESPDSAASMDGMLMGLRRSSKYSAHLSTTSRV
ncbi:hypothetical protein CCH79_00019959, partial [Gambusia affinis]